ncbi:hypothetical protein [Fictibacillus enclensis]|uniref:hypothetical protein n=1 Tax=Fictibacillus enclensis TaxID=1017270 RepID=UPI0024BF2C97|nr:hypothetical protein [Fictibacillus enclensis]WHY70635.1 hypothetical protein QNH15_16480 [Fictibacillus enclensis]
MQKDFRFSQEMKKEADLLNLNTITMDGTFTIEQTLECVKRHFKLKEHQKG